MEEKCENCKFWNLMAGKIRGGQCRRHAPKPVNIGLDVPFRIATWLITQRSDWCGEYEPKQL